MNMNTLQKAYVRYSEDGKIIPLSLVKTNTRPRIGKLVEVFEACCNADYVPFTGAGSQRAWLQTDKSGRALSGPIIRKFKPKSGYWIEVASSLCCNSSGSLPIITQQPVFDGDDTITVEATGENLTYMWQGFDGEGWINLNSYSCWGDTATTDTLVILEGECPTVNTYRVVITNAAGSVTSNEVIVP